MNAINFPRIESRQPLGFGMDLHWDSDDGFIRGIKGDDRLSDKVKSFLNTYSNFKHFFFAFQPKNRCGFESREYLRAYDDLFDALPSTTLRGFHHTALNLGTLDGAYPRAEIAAFTNELIKRYDLLWVNEDLGIWSLRGKVLPYPLPPFLTEDGLRAAIHNVRFYQEHLLAPLVVEFPGFTDGASFYMGNMDAFEFFGRLAEQTSVAVTLDTGHILGYQWLKNRRHGHFLDGLSALPFENTFEIHLSGSQIVNEKFRDLHHGVLLDEQLEILDYLLPRCPNLKCITYEDPKFHKDGSLISKAVPNFEKLRNKVNTWMNAEAQPN